MTGNGSGLLHFSLQFKTAEVFDDTFGAIRLAGFARVAAMQNEPVMSIFFELFRHHFQQFQLHLQGCFTRREAGPVRDPENVGIYGNGRFAECRVSVDQSSSSSGNATPSAMRGGVSNV